MKRTYIKVSTRLGIGFGAILLLLAATVGISIHYLGQLNAGTNAIVTDNYPAVLAAQNLLNNNNKIARSLRNFLLIKDPAKAAKERGIPTNLGGHDSEMHEQKT